MRIASYGVVPLDGPGIELRCIALGSFLSGRALRRLRTLGTSLSLSSGNSLHALWTSWALRSCRQRSVFTTAGSS